jgi:Kef-type K+ transport system membrane component KefB
MEIILGTLALTAGLINEEIFVALVIMAIVTSLFSAPFIRLFVKNDS